MPRYLSTTLVIADEADDPPINCHSIKDDEDRPVLVFDNITIIAYPRHLMQLITECTAWLLQHDHHTADLVVETDRADDQVVETVHQPS